MNRIIYVPQYPTPMRYQEWFYWKLPEEFKKMGFEVITIGEKYLKKKSFQKSKLDMFSPINEAINFETAQIDEYLQLELRDDDILFWSDISFPGLFGHVLFHKRPKKCFAFCHATSLNTYDYYQNDRSYKFPIETGLSGLFDKVFVGSKYHQYKLVWGNTIVTYLPFPPIEPSPIIDKKIDIISASRPNKQKVDLDLEKAIEKKFNLKIQRPVSISWSEYYHNLAKSKILLITSWEDTFGYQIIDAYLNDCIPLARNAYAYPELLSDDYLYNNENELFEKIEFFLGDSFDWILTAPFPKILCEKEMEDFYGKICCEMRD